MYLLPQPQSLVLTEGQFRLNYFGEIVIDPSLPSDAFSFAKLLQEEISQTTGFTWTITRAAKPFQTGSIIFEPLSGAGEQGYEMTVTSEAVRLKGQDCAGLLYAVQTLRQMLSQCCAVLPCLQLQDSPAILNRGFYHDVTRGRIPTLAQLKQLADVCSYFKINQLQLYVEHSFLFHDFQEMWRDDTPLTPEEILELDAYCRLLQIELVPSVASFGHLYKLLRTKTYEHLCELDAPAAPFSMSQRMGHHTIDVTNPESLNTIQNMLFEYMSLFTSRHFNICADETFDLGKGKSKNRAEEVGTHALYVEFVRQLADLVVKCGRIPMFWGDIILAEPSAIQSLPKETICLNWDYGTEAREDSTQKLCSVTDRIYLCPGVQGWNQLVDHYPAAYENISKMCTYAHKYHAMGVLNTDWGDYGHINPPEFSYIGLIYGAAFSWNKELISEEEINRQISVLLFGDTKGDLVSILSDIPRGVSLSWWQTVLYQEEQRYSMHHFDPDVLSFVSGITNAEKKNSLLENSAAKLYCKLPDLPQNSRRILSAYLLMTEGQSCLNSLIATIRQYKYQLPDPASKPPKELAAHLDNWIFRYKALWHTTSKESELRRIEEIFFWYADLLRGL